VSGFIVVTDFAVATRACLLEGCADTSTAPVGTHLHSFLVTCAAVNGALPCGTLVFIIAGDPVPLQSHAIQFSVIVLSQMFVEYYFV